MRAFEERQRAHIHRWVVATVMTGTFMGGLDTYIVNVSLPTVAATFGVAVAIVQWVPLAYLVAITSSLVIAGRASDLWGSRRVYLRGLLTFVLGSALCGAAPTALSLVVFRGVQGLGAGLFQLPNNSGVLGAAPQERLGTASGTLATLRQLGQVGGIGIAGTVWVTRRQPYLAAGLPGLVAQGAGFRDAFLVLAVAGLLAVVASALRGQGRSQESQPLACSQDLSTAIQSDHQVL